MKECVLTWGYLALRLKGRQRLQRKMLTMTNKKKIAADLQSALSGQSPLSIDLYVELLADHEDELKTSLDKGADDALLCMLADDGDVAMMVIDWDGSIHRNENGLKKLQSMWRHGFDANVQTLVPILSDHISQGIRGVGRHQVAARIQRLKRVDERRRSFRIERGHHLPLCHLVRGKRIPLQAPSTTRRAAQGMRRLGAVTQSYKLTRCI